MEDSMEQKIGYEIVIEEIGREASGAVRLRALAFEVVLMTGEPRRIAMSPRQPHRVRWNANGGQVPSESSSGDAVLVQPDPDTGPDAHVIATLVVGEAVVATSETHAIGTKDGGDKGRGSVVAGPTSSPPTAGGAGKGHDGDGALHGGRGFGGVPVPVRLTRAAHGSTRDLILWTAIRYSTASIKFPNFAQFLDYVVCGDDDAIPGLHEPLATDDRGTFSISKAVVERQARALEHLKHEARALRMGGGRLLTGTNAYRVLRDAADWFLRVYCGVLPPQHDFERIEGDLAARVGADLRSASGATSIEEAWSAYTVNVHGAHLLPYLNIVRERLSDAVPVHGMHRSEAAIACTGILQEKLTHPCFMELIWSYWQEEGMLVQTINAVSNRFQNRRSGPGNRDPLINLEIDSLRPLNNLMWGYVQDELNRLTVARRSDQYACQYGVKLKGLAVSHMRPVDRRSKFLEAFHNFLHRCLRFFQKDDDTTVHADGFPVLNAIKDVHYLLAEGASNQYGDLTSTARAEMLIQQWLLGRPEMREFLGGRRAVPYPEPWMDRVDAMKALQGWTDTSVVHFNDLATFGEQIVLGLRFGGWSLVNDPTAAANFARSWRAEIQGYECAYRAVTGVDLGAEVMSQQAAAERDLPPSFHLQRRLAARHSS